jgi:predicted phosphate transport protein (TIGR00153 family)
MSSQDGLKPQFSDDMLSEKGPYGPSGGTMRIPFISLFMTSPFNELQEHAEKVKECAWAFQQAIECHITDQCEKFEEFRLEVDKLESEADSIKRRIRGHLPKGTLMPADKFQLFRYLREQDKVLDAVEEALDWLSFRSEPGIPEALEKDFFLLVDAVMDPVEEMCRLVLEARKYFKSYSEKQRKIVKDIVHTIRRQEHDADKVEDGIKEKLLNMKIEAVTIFHMIRLAETIGSIADHAENAGDMVQSMIAK